MSGESSVYALGELPVIDLEKFLEGDRTAADEDCKVVVDCLHKYGILLVKDPRVAESENEVFIDQMEQYFERSEEVKKPDVHPEVYYQVGATPSFTEKARDHCERAKQYANENQPMTICPPEADHKWRFFWRIGDRPEASETKFPNLNAAQVIPEGFADWEEVMNRWGGLLLDTVKTVSEMAAVGFGLDKDEFAKKLNKAPHLLAPTGSDLGTYNKLGTMFANFHYDLNFITIHGRSRFPGLFVWLRDGTRSIVRVPKNCLLLQAGKQFEWMTGGHVLAGFHEVLVVPETLEAVEKAKAESKSLWRVSSTLFAHIASDQILEPIALFKNDRSDELYPPTYAGDQVKQELEAINLSK
eukprot:TRINITY_DN433_c0_g1_i1.p1 TRINITY_DN433_c0_g1~~TRINITY_DN433_c0_g1_i1.p1  ORF type:complete len:356 (+),score=109.30 TRINITY_DN433_c0_g1_i1:91-1158(+)